jgi:hypothetical protein
VYDHAKELLSQDDVEQLYHFYISYLSQIRDIAQWRVAKQTTVLAAELGGTFVADLKSRSCCIQVIGEH